MKQIATLLSLFLLAYFRTEAQDPHFSQFYASALQLNPALNGVFEGQMRIALNYRDQWASVLGSLPFRTAAINFDRRLRVGNGDYAAIGASVLRDQAGASRFTQTKALVGLSYLKRLSGGPNSQYLVAGVQFGGGQHTLDWGDIWFSRQFDPVNEVVDLDAPSGETQTQRSPIYADLNAGLLWYSLMGENKSVYFGGALNHVNNPNISFMRQGDETLYMRWVAHGGGEFPLSRQLSILPAIALMGQGPSLEVDWGGNLRFHNREWQELALRVGLWARVANKLESSMAMDALIVTAVLEMEKWNLGLSYDINTSSLNLVSNSRGAFEVSLTYTSAGSQRTDKVRCPKF